MLKAKTTSIAVHHGIFFLNKLNKNIFLTFGDTISDDDLTIGVTISGDL